MWARKPLLVILLPLIFGMEQGGRLGFKSSAWLFVLGLSAASCTSLLGIDEDYHKPYSAPEMMSNGAGGSSSGMGDCGDGILQGLEECDDKNETANDGCTQCVVDCDTAMGELKDPVSYHCYRPVMTPKLGWQDAESDCIRWGGHLASDTSKAENTFITMHVAGDFWLGATDAKMEGTFVWMDGEPMIYKAWVGSNPSNSNGGEDCVETTSDHGWNDDDCAKMQSYLCERTPAGGD